MEDKWRHWNQVVDSASSAPIECLHRRVCVPLVSGVVVGVMLTLLCPPFVCKHGSHIGNRRLCLFKVSVWMLLSSVLVAVITARGAFG